MAIIPLPITGWAKARQALKVIAPVMLVVGAAVLFWVLVVSPRMALLEKDIEQQAKDLSKAQDEVLKLEVQIAAQREIDTEKARATDDAAVARTERIERTTIIREAAAARAEASGDPEVSEAMDAFFADLRKGTGK